MSALAPRYRADLYLVTVQLRRRQQDEGTDSLTHLEHDGALPGRSEDRLRRVRVLVAVTVVMPMVVAVVGAHFGWL